MIIRHGEKAGSASTTQVGVDENGSPDKHSLTVRGWQRAGALVAFFASPTRPGIAKPNSIVAAASRDDVGIADEESKSRRAQQTGRDPDPSVRNELLKVPGGIGILRAAG